MNTINITECSSPLNRHAIFLHSHSVIIKDCMTESRKVIVVKQPLSIFLIWAQFWHQSVSCFWVRGTGWCTFPTFITLGIDSGWCRGSMVVECGLRGRVRRWWCLTRWDLANEVYWCMRVRFSSSEETCGTRRRKWLLWVDVCTTIWRLRSLRLGGWRIKRLRKNRNIRV